MRLPLSSAGLLLLALVLAVRPAAAQATRDQARLVITVAPGYVFGSDLWNVPDQPLLDASGAVQMTDILSLSRSVRPTLGVSFSGTYFPGDHLGLMAEAFLLGLGYNDSCLQRTSSGSARNALVCEAIDGAEKAASAVAISAGAVYRIHSRRTISPYARGSLGLVLSTQSSIRLTPGIDDPLDGAAEEVLVPVYVDDKDTRLTPALSLGVGFTAALSPGYQLRWEFRDHITGIQVVDGASAVSGIEPATSLEYRHLFGMIIGLDVVLERRRGRRY